MRCRRTTAICRACVVLVGLSGFSTQQSFAATLLPFGSEWAYFDDGFLPASDWAQRSYDDADWKFGMGEFGYGDGDENTLVNFGPDDEHKFITTYFRGSVYVGDPSQYESVTFQLRRDDGAVIYLNGVEIFRSNMPDEEVGYETYAMGGLIFPTETNLVSFTIGASLFLPGGNVLAAEVHQYEPASPDLSFDLELRGNEGTGLPGVIRGPYLQVGTPTNMTIRWRTSLAVDSRVQFGTTPTNLDRVASLAGARTEHEVTLNGLAPSTKYYYAIGTGAQVLAGDETYFFVTSPPPGTPQPTRIWAIGDFGTGIPAQYDVRDAFYNFTGSRYTDVWLMLGDNAYQSGLDHEYQANVFEVYPTLLRQSVVWPTIGNHETGQAVVLSDAYDYYRIFTMPTNGQAGGMASGSEHYYSFDYANIHFICLDSQTAVFQQPNSPMLQWLVADLEQVTADWTIAFWHVPPYTMGSHNSDIESLHIGMREQAVPILERYGVDLVLGGHSHNYERSYLLDGHYGASTSFSSTNILNGGSGREGDTGAYVKPWGGIGARQGAVYVVDGTSGGQYGFWWGSHPAMSYKSLSYGSVVIDVVSNRLDAVFLRDTGAIEDAFTILKGDYTNAVPLTISQAGTNAVLTWPSSSPPRPLEMADAINGSAWTALPGTATTNGPRRKVVVPATAGQRFFRVGDAR